MTYGTQGYARQSSGGLKLSRRLVGAVLVFMLIFMWSDGFSLNAFSFSGDFNILKLAAMFMMFGATGLLFMANPKHPAFNSSYGLSILGILFAVLLTTFYYLVVGAGLSVIEVFRVNLMYPGLFSFFVLAIMMNFNGAPDVAVRVIVATMLIYIVFLMIISADRQLADLFVVRTSTRFEETRITLREGLTLLGNLFFFLMLVKAGSARSTYGKAVYISLALLFLTYLVSVNMSRRTIMFTLVTVVLFVLFYGSATRRFHYLGAVGILCVFVFLTPMGEPVREGIDNAIFSSVSDFKHQDGTVGVRIEGIQFNMQIFADTGFVGIGNRSDRLPFNDPYFYGREIYRFHAGDHGLFGVIYRFGIIGLVVSLFLVYWIYKDTRFIRKHGTVNHRDIALAIWLVYLLGIISVDEMFWNSNHVAFHGLLFFLVWRMRYETTRTMVQLRDISAGARA